MADPLLEQLRKCRPDIRFCPATDGVIRGADLAETGNRSHGRDVYVSTREPPDVDLGRLRAGVTLRAGTRERYARCSLVCEHRGATVFVRVVDQQDRPLTRSLSYPGTADTDYDEAVFVWLGPVEDVCTPWSDNDPPQCQVLTVDGLRAFARRYGLDR